MAQSIEIFNNTEEIAQRFRELVSGCISNGHLDWVLSGGNTPVPVFNDLAQNCRSIPWDRIRFYWGDERCVGPEDPESNYRMARESLFDHIPLIKNQVHRILGENDPEKEARRYGDQILNVIPEIDGFPAFDLVMLGLGNDGHTASIFPDQMNLLDADQVCSVAVHPVSGQKRITLTGNVINNAGTVVFLVTGSAKAGIISTIINKKDGYLRFPAAHIRPVRGRLTWLIDKQAASKL